MKNRILALLSALLILCSLPLTAYAHDVPDVTREDCSIDVILRDKETKKGITDAELVCVRVGYVADDDGDFFFYDMTTNQVIENVGSKTTADALEAAVKNGGYPEEIKIPSAGSDGTYHAANLKTGLYLVMQKKAAKGYGDMSSFLVSVPYMVDGKYEYHVTANVKTELERTVETTEPTETTECTDEELPQTGQLNWPVPMLTAGGLTLIAIGYILRFGKRKEAE